MTSIKVTRTGYDPALPRDHPNNFDPTLEVRKPCGMIRPHHSDCECSLCKASKDEECAGTSVGTVDDSKTRVCATCAQSMEREGFTVTYDDMRS